MNEQSFLRRDAGSQRSRWYFAYGSNMNPARVTARGLEFRRAIRGWLPGWGMRFNKQSKDHPDCGHANLIATPANRGQAQPEVAEGVLYELTDFTMILRMDPYERAPINYSRECIWVQSDQGPIATWTYFANPALLQENLRPSRAYLDHLLAGKPFLSPSYYSMLTQQTVSE